MQNKLKTAYIRLELRRDLTSRINARVLNDQLSSSGRYGLGLDVICYDILWIFPVLAKVQMSNLHLSA